MIFSSRRFFQKTNERIRLYYYDTSGHFEINWPLALPLSRSLLKNSGKAAALPALPLLAALKPTQNKDTKPLVEIICT